jgi:hypothetical protein
MASYPWRFFRAGGFDQARLESGRDILALDTLDQKLWAALACPVAGIAFDRRTLEMLDADGDGRVRAADLLREVAWLKQVLKDPEELVRDGADLRLSAIDGETAEGARVLASARRIVTNLGRPDDQTIGLDDTLDTERIFAATRFNGDGVVPAAAADDAATAQLIEDVIACVGGAPDRSGQPGITALSVEAFFSDIDRYAEWLAGEEPLAGSRDGADALAAVADKIDGYFLLGRLAAFGGPAVLASGLSPDLLVQLEGKGVADSLALLAPLPLAAAAPDGQLPLDRGINPAWAEALERFRILVVEPELGDARALSATQWADIRSRYAERLAWMARRPDTPVAGLGEARIQAIAATNARSALEALVAQDQALAGEADAIGAVERLIRLRQGFCRLLNNFVSFREFYGRQNKAVFQAGTLYLDGRSADLCVRVDDPARHAALATLSHTYLVYCECRRQGAGEKMTIAAAFTAGDSDQLMAGRNGVFYDRDGRDWDATIVKLVEHPISMRQAFWLPYKQAARLIGAQIEKLASTQAQQVPAQVAQVVGPPGPAKPPAASPPAAAPAFDVARFAGIFAAIGLAVGAIGTAVASVVTGFLTLVWWQMPLALAGILGAISGPSMLIAFMKLRQRNLAPILDATGWAVNARVRITIPFGGSLTALARLPDGAERSLADPYAERRPRWGLYLLLAASAVLAVIVWQAGWLAPVLR